MIEEAAGPAGPKLVRLLCFVGAGFISTVGINKWLELQKKSSDQKMDNLSQNPSNAVNKAVVK